MQKLEDALLVNPSDTQTKKRLDDLHLQLEAILRGEMQGDSEDDDYPDPPSPQPAGNAPGLQLQVDIHPHAVGIVPVSPFTTASTSQDSITPQQRTPTSAHLSPNAAAASAEPRFRLSIPATTTTTATDPFSAHMPSTGGGSSTPHHQQQHNNPSPGAYGYPLPPSPSTYGNAPPASPLLGLPASPQISSFFQETLSLDAQSDSRRMWKYQSQPLPNTNAPPTVSATSPSNVALSPSSLALVFPRDGSRPTGQRYNRADAAPYPPPHSDSHRRRLQSPACPPPLSVPSGRGGDVHTAWAAPPSDPQHWADHQPYKVMLSPANNGFTGGAPFAQKQHYKLSFRSSLVGAADPSTPTAAPAHSPYGPSPPSQHTPTTASGASPHSSAPNPNPTPPSNPPVSPNADQAHLEPDFSAVPGGSLSDHLFGRSASSSSSSAGDAHPQQRRPLDGGATSAAPSLNKSPPSANARTVPTLAPHPHSHSRPPVAPSAPASRATTAAAAAAPRDHLAFPSSASPPWSPADFSCLDPTFANPTSPLTPSSLLSDGDGMQF